MSKIINNSEMIKIATERPLSVEEFDDYFKPLCGEDESILLLPTTQDGLEKLNSIVAEKFNTSKTYQHVWTLVDTSEGLAVLNGFRAVNRLDYIICETPWGDGTENDSKIYLESEY